MQAFNDAATEVASKIDPKYLKPGDQLLVGFNGPFVSRGVTPRDLLSEYIGSMVSVRGIVTKCINFQSYLLLCFHFTVAIINPLLQFERNGRFF